jgi:hypothetical protein
MSEAVERCLREIARCVESDEAAPEWLLLLGYADWHAEMAMIAEER